MESSVSRSRRARKPVTVVAPNPIEQHDRALAHAFESAVADVLPADEAVLVRFGVWDGEEDGARFYCKVEAVPEPQLDARPAWRWWSPLVRTPADLATSLADVIRRRRTTMQARPDAVVRAHHWGWGAVEHAKA
jgi:hypothetical protein